MKNTLKPDTKIRAKVKIRTACPLCGCKELLTEGLDQFCLSCDWDTCAEYVEKGWMDHLEFACRSHFPNSAKEPAALNPQAATRITVSSSLSKADFKDCKSCLTAA